MPKNNFAECELCACFLARRTARLITHYFDKALRPCGLRATQYTLLVALIRFSRPVMLTELSDLLGIERTTLTRNLQTLQESGYIQVEIGQDKRMRLITITLKGKHIVKRAYPYWEKAQTNVTQDIPVDTLQNIAKAASLIQ